MTITMMDKKLGYVKEYCSKIHDFTQWSSLILLVQIFCSEICTHTGTALGKLFALKNRSFSRKNPVLHLIHKGRHNLTHLTTFPLMLKSRLGGNPI